MCSAASPAGTPILQPFALQISGTGTPVQKPLFFSIFHTRIPAAACILFPSRWQYFHADGTNVERGTKNRGRDGPHSNFV